MEDTIEEVQDNKTTYHKYNAQEIMNIMCVYFDTRSYLDTSRILGYPKSSVQYIVERHIEDDDFVKIRLKKEEEFVQKANHLIFKAINKLNKELDEQEHIPINQLTTAIGTLYDKKTIAQTGIMGNDTPSVQINIVNNEDLEKTLYEEEE
jgi:predicted ATP-grasp superfamily ATP-dependent carboligase